MSTRTRSDSERVCYGRASRALAQSAALLAISNRWDRALTSGPVQRRWTVKREGRCLRIIYVPDPKPDSVFVITAYEMVGKPLAAYRRRMRKKRR